jgi:hypothetical protein
MLWTICFMLLLMWMFGMVSANTSSGLVHFLGICACSNSVDQWPPSSHLRHFFALTAAPIPLRCALSRSRLAPAFASAHRRAMEFSSRSPDHLN